jgi:hypothetical protein
MVKTKRKEDVKAGETSRLAGIKSADKFTKKPRELISPTLQNLTLRHYDCEASNAHEPRENPYKVKERDERPPVPILSTRTSKTILSE